uniref:Uncharacterized protein n=2 Tax=Clytia hemisphaerica TaxID=252671 RepID=A0A7M5XK13_9CNID
TEKEKDLLTPEELEAKTVANRRSSRCHKTSKRLQKIGKTIESLDEEEQEMVLAMTGEVMTDEESDEDENNVKIIMRRKLSWRSDKFELSMEKINSKTTNKTLMYRVNGLPSTRQPSENTNPIFVRNTENVE